MQNNSNFITDDHCYNVSKLIRHCGFHLEGDLSPFNFLLAKQHKFFISFWPLDGIAMVETGEPCLTPARTFDELLDLLIKIKAITPKQKLKCGKEEK